MRDTIRKKSTITKLGAYMRGEGCRKHLSCNRFAKDPVKIFWFDNSACPLLCSVLFKNSFQLSNHEVFLMLGFDHAIQTDGEWTARHGRRSRGHAAPVGHSRCVESSRHKARLPDGPVRRLYRRHYLARCLGVSHTLRLR